MDKTLKNWLGFSQVVFKCVHGNLGKTILYEQVIS